MGSGWYNYVASDLLEAVQQMLDVLRQDHRLKGRHLRGVGQMLLLPGPTPHEAHGGVQGPDLPPMRFPVRQGTPQTVLQREHLRVIDCGNTILGLPPREVAEMSG